VFGGARTGKKAVMSGIPKTSTSNPTPAAAKDPDEWVTGDEPMTGAQASDISTLKRASGRDVPETMTKAEASKLIDELQAQSDRARSKP
jgi:hypothetical protein